MAAPSATIRTLRCDFVRNSAIANRLILQDTYRAEVAYWLTGFHFSSALFSRSVNSVGSWLVLGDAAFIEFFNSSGIPLLGSQSLIRSSAPGVDMTGHKSEWVDLSTLENPGIKLLSGQPVSLYAFASSLNTQRNFTTIALELLPVEE